MKVKEVNFLSLGLAIIFFACLTIPWLYYRIGTRTGLFFLVFWIVVNYSSIQIPHSKTEIKFYILFVLYCLLFWLYPMVGYGSYPTFAFIPKYGNAFACVFIVYVYFRDKRYKELKLLTWAILACYMVSSVINISHLGVNDELARAMTAGTDTGEARFKGIGRMDFIEAMAIFAPMFFYVGVKAEKKAKLFLLTVSFLMAWAVFRASYVILSLSMAVGYLIAVGSFWGRARTAVIWTIISAIVIGVFHPGLFVPLIAFIEWIMGLIPDARMYMGRLKEVVQSIETGEIIESGDMGVRQYVYKMAFDSFKQSPLIGMGTWVASTGRSPASGHSEIFDALACMGLVWVVFVVGMFRAYYKSIREIPFPRLSLERRNLYSIVIWPAILMAFLDPCGSPVIWGVLFFLVPSMPLFITGIEFELNMSSHFQRMVLQQLKRD